MLPILITVLVTVPILALGTWLYLRRRTLSPRVRILLMAVLFLFVLISGPVIMWMWARGGTTRDIASTGSGGVRFLGQLPLLWLLGVLGTGAQVFRLCRKKGEL
jgi:glucan phosphoethanolaminetransferase (alkaline phosphatase superfamily)